MTSRTLQITATDGGTFDAWLAVPDPLPPTAGVVVVLQEIFGVNANIRAIADDLAAAGHVAVAPDLFWRQEAGVALDPSLPEDRDRATGLMKGLDVDSAVRDAASALDQARAVTGATGPSAAVGYCLGGKIAFLLAARTPLDAAVSYYGVGVQGVLAEAPSIRGLLLLHIAGDDHLCPPEAQAAIAAGVSGLGDRVAVLTYPGVGHAFARRGGAAFDGSSAARADAATLAALAGTLPLG